MEDEERERMAARVTAAEESTLSVKVATMEMCSSSTFSCEAKKAMEDGGGGGEGGEGGRRRRRRRRRRR